MNTFLISELLGVTNGAVNITTSYYFLNPVTIVDSVKNRNTRMKTLRTKMVKVSPCRG